MQLREIHIEGFGVFADAHVRGLASGLNVLYGQNEFGKTTLLEFIRRVLFGFPGKASNTNPYPPLRGGRYGGHLVCQLRDPSAPEITVSRTSGKGGGALTVRTGGGEEMSEESFRAALDHVSDEFYRNVYAVSLQELQEDRKKQLQGEELRHRIYGAGLGLGQVSITELKKSFSDAAERLYRPRGSTQDMNATASKLIELERRTKTIAGELAQYDAKKSELDGLSAEAGELRAQQRALQSDLHSLENQRSLYDTFVQMREAQRQLTELGHVTDIPDSAVGQMRTQQREIEALEKRLKEAQEQRSLKRSELEALNYDAGLLQHEDDIKALLSGLTQFRGASRDLPLRMSEQQTARERVGHGIRELGADWDEGRVRDFVLTTDQKDALRSLEAELMAAQRAFEKAKDRVEDYRQQSRASRARPTLPLTYRIIGLAILILGAAGCVYSAVNGHSIPAVVSGAAAALGLVVALSLGSTSGPLRDKTMDELSADADRAEQQFAAAQSAWSSQLASLGLAPTLSPDAVTEQLRSLANLRDNLIAIDERQARIEEMEAVITTARKRLTEVAATLAAPLPTSDTAAGIEALDARLDRAQEVRATKDGIVRDIELLDRRIATLSTDVATTREQLATSLLSSGVATPEDFITLHERAVHARELRQEIRRGTLTIEKTVGVGPACEEFMALMEGTTPEQVLSRLSEVKETLSEVEAQLEAANRRVGGLQQELNALTSSETQLEMEANAESLRQQLRDSFRAWACTQLALWAIDQAISRYETSRQPAVIRQAQEAFNSITGGSYPTLVSPLGSSELYVRDREGKDRTIDELSRGTREQLYLAMRLGLIEQYEQNAEPLPVVMDDILVNFDDLRGPLAVRALAEFARNRQVIVMTCHESTRELYRKAGASELRLQPGVML